MKLKGEQRTMVSESGEKDRVAQAATSVPTADGRPSWWPEGEEWHPRPKPPRGLKGKFYNHIGVTGDGLDPELLNPEILATVRSRIGSKTVLNWIGPWDLTCESVPFDEEPIYLLKNRRSVAKLRDLEINGGVWFVSDHLKAILEGFDPGAFVFQRILTRFAKGEPGPSQWVGNVVRVLDALDTEMSDYKIETNPDGSWYYSFLGSTHRSYRQDVVGDAHIFHITHSSRLVFDRAAYELFRREKLKLRMVDCGGF